MAERATILIVDDEPVNIQLLGSILADEYEIKVASSGQEALRIMQMEAAPDLVLLDIVMPEMDGYEVARQIRSDGRLREIPFIFLTSKQTDDNIVQGFVEGAADYIAKPFSTEVLLARVHTHVQLSLLRQELMETLKRRERDLALIDEYILMVHMDLQGKIVAASQAYTDLCGFTVAELIEKKRMLFVPEKIPVDIYNGLWEALSAGKVWTGELQNVKKEGGTFWLDVTISPEYDVAGKRTGFIAVANDITSRKYIEKLSEIDHLTQVFNRKKIETLLNKEIHRATRYDTTFSVIMIDIDHFKRVNDTYGHQVGDEVLVGAASLIKHSVRLTDSVGRMGGEEFLVICAQTELEASCDVAEKLRQSLSEKPFETAGFQTASFGVSTYHEGDTPESIVKRADDALYKAKEAGRNRVVSQ
jgi:diguanylate cyclase (GGDEF)-like protein/PAS domain S-box-containing protein